MEGVPSGKQTVCYRKLPKVRVDSPIKTVIFLCYANVCQRVPAGEPARKGPFFPCIGRRERVISSLLMFLAEGCSLTGNRVSNIQIWTGTIGL